jgi:hypothetical protein
MMGRMTSRSPRLHGSLRDAGAGSSVKRVARMIRQSKSKSMRGYRHPRYLRQAIYRFPY